MSRLNLAVWRSLALVCLLAGTAAAQLVSSLQGAVEQAMAGQRGTAVVLDVGSGRVITSSHLDVAARRVSAPGSSIKPFTLRALLEAGKLNGQTALLCKRKVRISGRSLDCSHPATTDPLDPAEALAYSCNSYFTTVALRLTPQELQQNFLQDGLASPTGLTSDEASGQVLLAHTSDELQLQAIGEWGIRITPLELAKAYRGLALLRQKNDPTLRPTFAGLEQSVSYGMARAAQPAGQKQVAGKTGTTPAENGAWTHAWFAGYAPADDPQIVVVVFLEKGHGGSEAAGVARSIFSFYETGSAVKR